MWSSTGTLLATATFTNETASGWQTVTFSNPVAIAAGTTYVASYHSNGHYTATGNYFTTARVNGPLTAPAANNGVYTYGTGNLFPTSSFGAANYWVDVIFSPASGGANQAPVAANDSGFSVTQNSPMSIAASTLLANDTDPDGDTLTITGAGNGVNGTASFNAQSNTVTFTPNSGYTGPASFTYAISDGRGGTASASVSLVVNTASANIVSLFSSNPTPSIASVNDPSSVELGFKFQASGAGDVTGLRFYKGASNTGTTCRASLDQHRYPARHRHLHERDGERMAAGELRHAGDNHCRNDVCCVLSHVRKLRRRSQPVWLAGQQRTADCTSVGCERRQRRVCLWIRQPFSRQTVSTPRVMASTLCSVLNLWPDGRSCLLHRGFGDLD